MSSSTGRVFYFPFAHSLKLGLETFSATFPRTALEMIWGD